jgi:hypothetical protein
MLADVSRGFRGAGLVFGTGLAQQMGEPHNNVWLARTACFLWIGLVLHERDVGSVFKHNFHPLSVLRAAMRYGDR